MDERSTDRRRFTSWPVPEERLERLAAEARGWDTDAVAVTDVTDRFRIDLLATPFLRGVVRRWSHENATY